MNPLLQETEHLIFTITMYGQMLIRILQCQEVSKEDLRLIYGLEYSTIQ